MGGKALAKAKTDEILRLKNLGMAERAISRALKIHRCTVKKYLDRDQSMPQRMDRSQGPLWTKGIDWDEIIKEFSSGVPLNVLWEEQIENAGLNIQYSGFWKQFKKRFPNLPKSMHRVFAPGDRTEIDYCDGIDILDPITGEIRKTHLFVGVLCHSRYAFAEFSLSQKSEDFLASHKRMFDFFGGVTQVVSPDNLKSAVTKAHRYDPEINPAYTRLAEHYGVGVVPARVRRPKDKAIVERTIQIFQRWFYFKVRKKTFTSLTELNRCLSEYLEIFNNKTHRVFRCSRKERFESEKQHLRALPETPYNIAIHHKAILHPDCHLVFEKNYYSAPHILRGESLDVWASANCVEIYFNGERVAFHSRSKTRAKFKTDKSHYPEAHRAYYEATPKHLRNQAARLGGNVSKIVHGLLSGDAPLRYVRRAQGIIRMEQTYGKEALNKACGIALEFSQSSCGFIERIIKTNSKSSKGESVPIPKRGDNELLRGDELFH